MAVPVPELLAAIRAGASDRAIAQSLKVNRRTVARYRRAAGIVGGGPDLAVPPHIDHRLVRSPGRASSVDRYREEIAALRAAGLPVTAIRARLAGRFGEPVSYSAVWRLARRLQEEGRVARSTGPAPAAHRTGTAAESLPVLTDPTPGTPPATMVAGSAADDLGNPLIPSRLTNEGMLAERHAHLVATATDLLLHRGFHRTSVRDIAAAAGWQIGTLYLYISRKEDILLLILDAITRSFLADLRQVERQPTARATLRAAAERYFRAVARMHRELRLLYRESASLDPEQRRFGMQREFAQRDVLADIIRWGIAGGEFRPVHPEAFAHTMIMLAHMWGLKGWALIGVLSLDQFIEEQLALIFARLDPIADLIPRPPLRRGEGEYRVLG